MGTLFTHLLIACAAGCRAGENCQYQHTAIDTVVRSQDEDNNGGQVSVPSRRPTPTKPREVVAKPVSAAQQEDPRQYQIDQVTKRFAAKVEQNEKSTSIAFSLPPSDPDFPYELKGGLRCSLHVPKGFPQDGLPTLRISNEEMPRGYQINVERGFDELIRQSPQKTLLAHLNELDRQLERILTSEKAQTLKISANAPRKGIDDSQDAAARVESQSIRDVVQRAPAHTSQQKLQARTKRETDVRQLEARMGRLPLYSKSADGTIYNLPLQLAKVARLPASLQAVKEIVLFVPPLYNLEPCTVHLKGIESPEAQNVEVAFEKHSRLEKSTSLMAHINFLTQNMHTMALESADQVELQVAEQPAPEPPGPRIAATTVSSEGNVQDADRPHVRLIPRPPEWDTPDDDSDSSSEYSDSDYSGSSGPEAEDVGGAILPARPALSTSDKGIAISFPDIEFYGIELIEVYSLALTLKCDRCKTTVDISNLRPSTASNTISVSHICPKCAYELFASYHSEALHAHNTRAGYLDLTSCTVQDLLPSVFIPTCSKCSTPYDTPPGITTVRGDTTLTVCRTCHQKLTIKMSSVKFLRVSTTAPAHPLLPRKKPARENLGITTGTPLPEIGRCTHYRKSHRWFRFSCCNKVFACDRCHDEKAEPKHVNEHANRMICGWCSREQNYRPHDCGFCGRSLVGRKGGGFWEGGKGTRDRAKMSRKEPRKYKRQGGGAKSKAKEN